MSNPFYTDASKEVDDDEFLNHPRSGSSGYMLQNSRNVNSTSYNQFNSGASRDVLGLDTEGNRENGMDRVQVISPPDSRYINPSCLKFDFSYKLMLIEQFIFCIGINAEKTRDRRKNIRLK